MILSALFFYLSTQVKDKNSRKRMFTVGELVGRGRYAIVADGSRQSYEALSRDLTVIKPADAFKWTIVEPEEPKSVPKEYNNIGLVDFDFETFRSQLFDVESEEEYKYPFGHLIKKLWPGDAVHQIQKMNAYIKVQNEKRKQAKAAGTREVYREIKLVSEFEFWRFVGILMLSTVVKRRGTKLWDNGKRGDKKVGERRYNTFSKAIDLGPSGLNIMAEYRFAQMKDAFAFAFDDGKSNPWSQIQLLFDGLNENRIKDIAASIRKVLNK